MKRWMVGMLALASGVALVGCLPQDQGGQAPCPCPGGGGSQAIVVNFETVDQGERSGIRDERQVVVRDAQGWAALWAEHVAGRIPEPPVPEVDFTREMVIGYFLGERPTGGYFVEVQEIWVLESKVWVRVVVTSPRPGDPVIQVLTQPYHLVRMAYFDHPVEFVIVEKK